MILAKQSLFYFFCCVDRYEPAGRDNATQLKKKSPFFHPCFSAPLSLCRDDLFPSLTQLKMFAKQSKCSPSALAFMPSLNVRQPRGIQT
jgi:hypothetical protein